MCGSHTPTRRYRFPHHYGNYSHKPCTRNSQTVKNVDSKVLLFLILFHAIQLSVADILYIRTNILYAIFVLDALYRP